MNFEFATSARIIFGAGSIRQAGKLARSFGRKALITCGTAAAQSKILTELLASEGVEGEVFSVYAEPTIDLVEQGIKAARRISAELVIGFGGGSAIDTGKAIAALLNNPGSILDYLEVIGSGKPMQNSPLPFIAIPTTAGTGAEVTRNAVLGSPAHNVKVSLRSPQMLPKVALVDPELTYSLPPEVTATTGMDALTQLIEPYVSPIGNPLTDAICREGINRAARSLLAAFTSGDDRQAREDMSLASLLGGLALANAKLGAVHGFAGPLGGLTRAPHGVICARLLPEVMETNIQALANRLPASPALERYREIAVMLTREAQAGPQDGVNWVRILCQKMNIAGLGGFGLSQLNREQLIQAAARSSSMKGNPVLLTAEEMGAILEKAL